MGVGLGFLGLGPVWLHDLESRILCHRRKTSFRPMHSPVTAAMTAAVPRGLRTRFLKGFSIILPLSLTTPHPALCPHKTQPKPYNHKPETLNSTLKSLNPKYNTEGILERCRAFGKPSTPNPGPSIRMNCNPIRRSLNLKSYRSHRTLNLEARKPSNHTEP